MVGVTRRWISMFMQRFHNLGLIETNADQFLIQATRRLARADLTLSTPKHSC